MTRLPTRLYRGDCRDILPELRGEVQLIVTSPPYNVGWRYGDDGEGDRLPLADYRRFLATVLERCYGALRPGGVLALNLPPSIAVYPADEDGLQVRPLRGKARETTPSKRPKPIERAYPIAAWAEMELEANGWLMREPLVWAKFSASSGKPHAVGTAIGAPANPYLRPCHERIILASKGSYTIPRVAPADWEAAVGVGSPYLEWCKDVWPLRTGQTARGGGPLAFPDPLVERLVGLYSDRGDVVLDPFAGSGTVGRVAIKLGRRALLIEKNPAEWAKLEGILGQATLAGL